MYNTDMPTRAELPTTKQLLRSTVIALVAAIVMLVTVILPAEYAIDPTGIGRMIGLSEMGEIKSQLVQEAAADQAKSQVVKAEVSVTENEVTPVVVQPTVETPVQAETINVVWKDEMTVSLKPGQGAEIKLVMEAGQTARFAWGAQGGPINFDTHGDGNGNSISYEKGRGVPSDEGELVAAFTGNHGWFFRNRNEQTVTVVLKTGGEYAQIKRVL